MIRHLGVYFDGTWSMAAIEEGREREYLPLGEHPHGALRGRRTMLASLANRPSRRLLPYAAWREAAPAKSAFGSRSHPAALLDQVRANAAWAEWWCSQLEDLIATDGEPEASRDRALAEWSMALWCVAAPNVVVELFADWQRVMRDLPEPRRRPVVDAALRCSAHGWLPELPTELPAEDSAVLITCCGSVA